MTDINDMDIFYSSISEDPAEGILEAQVEFLNGAIQGAFSQHLYFNQVTGKMTGVIPPVWDHFGFTREDPHPAVCRETKCILGSWSILPAVARRNSGTANIRLAKLEESIWNLRQSAQGNWAAQICAQIELQEAEEDLRQLKRVVSYLPPPPPAP